jgi:hypothetical protein
MKAFRCQVCRQSILFENTRCESCGRKLGYLPRLGEMTAVEPVGDGWVALADGTREYRFCKNWELYGCNWMVEKGGPSEYCLACQHNRTVPDLSDDKRHAAWQKIETAKRRLFYSIIRLNLPAPNASDNDGEPLIFDFLAEELSKKPVLTGHSSGLITIALKEADDPEREKMRDEMGEPYRTLLGHFRHEVGHYYWERIVPNSRHLAPFRELFGDERDDYSSSLKKHYEEGPSADWRQNHISAYASCHPWEDFAETFAHYLHIVDTLETGRCAGLVVRRNDGSPARVDFDPYNYPDINEMIDNWLDISFALNNINRSMGQPDIYPFVISPVVKEKLGFVQSLLKDHAHRPCVASGVSRQGLFPMELGGGHVPTPPMR